MENPEGVNRKGGGSKNVQSCDIRFEMKGGKINDKNNRLLALLTITAISSQQPAATLLRHLFPLFSFLTWAPSLTRLQVKSQHRCLIEIKIRVMFKIQL